VRSTIVAAVVAALIVATGATAAGVKLITGRQIKNGSIGLVDLSSGAKRSLKGQQGPRGPAGTIAAITTVHVVKTLPPGAIDFAVAPCPAGQAPVSGGFAFPGSGGVFFSFGGSSSWAAGGDNFFGVLNADLEVWVRNCFRSLTSRSASFTSEPMPRLWMVSPGAQYALAKPRRGPVVPPDRVGEPQVLRRLTL